MVEIRPNVIIKTTSQPVSDLRSLVLISCRLYVFWFYSQLKIRKFNMYVFCFYLEF